MLMHKGAHGTGETPSFPTKKDIEKHMEGTPEDFFVKVYGDGSYSTPETWWTALGGIGAVVADWNEPGEDMIHRRKWDMKEAIVGQTGSSTRMELLAWIRILAEPIRTDSR